MTTNYDLQSPEDSSPSNVQIFSSVFSVYYVFYEQYLTIWSEALFSLTLSIVVVFLVTFILTGFSFFSALIVVINVFMIIIDIGGLMYWWDISLNAVSLVNLVVVSNINFYKVENIQRIINCF